MRVIEKVRDYVCGDCKNRDHEFEECMSSSKVGGGFMAADRCEKCRRERFTLGRS